MVIPRDLQETLGHPLKAESQKSKEKQVSRRLSLLLHPGLQTPMTKIPRQEFGCSGTPNCRPILSRQSLFENNLKFSFH